MAFKEFENTNCMRAMILKRTVDLKRNPEIAQKAPDFTSNSSALRRTSLFTFSLLISEDFWRSLDFPSDRIIFSTLGGGKKNTAIAGKGEETPEFLTNW